MKTHALTKIEEQKLHSIVRAIKDRESTIDEIRDKARDIANQGMLEIILQGQDLIKAASIVPPNLFDNWLKANCPQTADHAKRYMKVASDAARAELANPLKQLAMLEPTEEEIKSDGDRLLRKVTADLRGLYIFNRFAEFCLRHPLNKFPDGTKQELKMQMEPIVKALWPEKFTN